MNIWPKSYFFLFNIIVLHTYKWKLKIATTWPYLKIEERKNDISLVKCYSQFKVIAFETPKRKRKVVKAPQNDPSKGEEFGD